MGQGSIEVLQGAEEFVCGSERWAGKVVVAEVECVTDGDCACVFGEHLVAPVVFHGGAEIETVAAAVVP